ncbi:hypothetical protein HDU92_007802 [Lobulomyces angularis]|nr:hypothetical protein HDU92_007802 [Lobulomyces angularis]
MDSTFSNETKVNYFGDDKLICSTCYVNCSTEFQQLIYSSPLPIEKLNESFSNCFCNSTTEILETFNLTTCNSFFTSTVDGCRTTHYGFPTPASRTLFDVCNLNPIPDEFFSQYHAKLVANAIEVYPESSIPQKKLEYGPFIIIAVFSLLAVFIIRKFVKDKKRTNQVFDTSLPSNAAISLNERSLYYYQEEFGNEQLPKYGGDLEFQPSSEILFFQKKKKKMQ